MPKQGEIDYLRNIGPEAVQHALGLPFSDAACPRLLVELGTAMACLPPPPARILDLGCGTGWTSWLLARRGYQVLGIDLAPDMIACAERQYRQQKSDHLRFQICDYEEMDFQETFEGAVFFGSLHHALDEEEALRRTWRALQPGGVCVTCEPGVGHRQTPAAVEAMRRFRVTEKDMPPARIMALGRKVGFSPCRLVPHPLDLTTVGAAGGNWVRRIVRLGRFLAESPWRSGLVVLHKPRRQGPSAELRSAWF